MAKWGKVDYEQLKRLQKKLDKIENKERDEFCKECAKEIATRLLAKVIKRTPVGKYPKGSGKVGGTLRRGWTIDNQELKVQKNGDKYVIEVINSVSYASYVNNGHRTANHNGWVPGQFFLEISENEIQQLAPKIIEKKIEEFLRGVFDD